MRKQLDAVALFHDTFQIEKEESPKGKVESALYELRHRLMEEENEEYLEAAQKGDLNEIADALGDMLYILCGTIHTHGLHNIIEEVFEEIQRSNMSKLGADGKPLKREDGKIVKGENYFKADIAGVMRKGLVKNKKGH